MVQFKVLGEPDGWKQRPAMVNHWIQAEKVTEPKWEGHQVLGLGAECNEE
jgi:hypothetical protein